MPFRGGGVTIDNFGPAAGSIAVGQAEADGASGNTVRADHRHAFPAAVAGAGATTSTPGDTEADGAAGPAARADHRHARADAYASSVVGPDAWGAPAAVGTSSATARADHHHGALAQILWNAKDYGAKGDGVTNDSAAIAAAISACSTAGGGVVWLPPGTYLVGASVAPPSHVWVVGSGQGATIIRLANTVNLPVVAPANNVAHGGVEGLTIDGNATNNSAPGAAGNEGVYVTNGSAWETVDVEVTNCLGAGIEYSACTGCSIIRPYTHANGVESIWLTGGSGNIVDLPRSSGDTYGILLQSETSSRVRNPWVINATGANSALTESAGVAFYQCSGCEVTGGFSLGHAHLRGAYLFESTDCKVLGLTASNNGTASGNAGIDVDSNTLTGFESRHVISGCICDSNGGSGILLTSSSDNLVTGNRCTNNGSFNTASAYANGITLAVDTPASDHCDRNVITNNICRNTGAGVNQQAGVALANGAAPANFADNVVAHNVLVGNVGDPVRYLFNGNHIYDNVGANPSGHWSGDGIRTPAQAAVPASGTAYTNAASFHAMVLVTGGSVTNVAIGGQNTGATSGWFRVPAGQTITLTYTVAPTWQWFGD